MGTTKKQCLGQMSEQPRLEDRRAASRARAGLVARTAVAVLVGSALLVTWGNRLQARAPSTGATKVKVGNESYRLSGLDSIRVSVHEWRPSKDEVYAWTALNREYKIGPSGILALPLIGEISAVGLTPSELSEMISERLRSALDLAMLPHSTVEVVSFRPVYVTGDVEKSGETSFAPGMTVLQAVSLSGGLRQDKETPKSNAKTYITTSGELDLLQRERAMLVARKARLEAELASADFVGLREEDIVLARRGGELQHISAFVRQEEQAFEGRRRSKQTQVRALTELKEHLEQEAASLTSQLSVHDKQIELYQRELDNLRTLAAKRLVTEGRLLGVERNLVQLEGERLRIQAALSRAQQEAKRASISLIEVENSRTNSVIDDLQQIQFRLDLVSRRAAMVEDVLVETSVLGGNQTPSGDANYEVQYTIMRVLRDKVISIEATEASRLESGDVLKVRFVRHFALPVRKESEPDSAAGALTNAVRSGRADLRDLEIKQAN